MDNEALKKYIGHSCHISGEFSINIELGKIIEVYENWIEVDTNEGIELISIKQIECIKFY